MSDSSNAARKRRRQQDKRYDVFRYVEAATGKPFFVGYDLDARARFGRDKKHALGKNPRSSAAMMRLRVLGHAGVDLDILATDLELSDAVRMKQVEIDRLRARGVMLLNNQRYSQAIAEQGRAIIEAFLQQKQNEEVA